MIDKILLLVFSGCIIALLMIENSMSQIPNFNRSLCLSNQMNIDISISRIVENSRAFKDYSGRIEILIKSSGDIVLIHPEELRFEKKFNVKEYNETLARGEEIVFVCPIVLSSIEDKFQTDEIRRIGDENIQPSYLWVRPNLEECRGKECKSFIKCLVFGDSDTRVDGHRF